MFAIKRILSIAAASLFAEQASAEPYAAAPPYDPSADWCTEGLPYSSGKEIYAPDGAITQVGPYFFHVCQGGARGSTPDRRVMRFFYNPERVQGLSSVKVMTGLRLNNLGTWDERRQDLLDTHRLVGEQQIGAAIYGVYRYVRFSDGELGRRKYLYIGDTADRESAMPPHTIDCTEPVVAPYMLGGHCFLTVGYDEIFANLLFLSLVPESPKIPLARFPDFALDVKRMLEAADVTKEHKSSRSELPLLK
ncbi:MAG: hypothetical protein AAGK03_12255 [Pseudomonadota bacterium]